MRLIAIGGLAAWAGIVALAWWLADARIDICGFEKTDCELRATAARDAVLIWGLIVSVISILAVTGVAQYRRHRRGAGSIRTVEQWQPMHGAAPLSNEGSGGWRDAAPDRKKHWLALHWRSLAIGAAFAIYAAALVIVQPQQAQDDRAMNSAEQAMADVEANAEAEAMEYDGIFDDLIPATRDPHADIARPAPDTDPDP